MKYIVFQVRHASGMVREIPVTFPNDLSHVEVANGLLAHCAELENGVPVGAGEFSCLDMLPQCSGRSTTLNLDSRGDRDSKAFSMRDYTMGMVDDD